MASVEGPFEVDFRDEVYDRREGTTLSRRKLRKHFHGALEGDSSGDFLLAVAASGAAAYVGVERFEGSLAGRRGSFVLVHSAHRSPERQSAHIPVLPGSGSDELAGLRGELEITVDEAGAHRYRLEYEGASGVDGTPGLSADR